MKGVSDRTFAPKMPITRAMLITVLHRQEGEPVAAPATFSDVAEGNYYAPAIAWASANGLVNGFGDGSFRPDEPVTREQLATIFYRYAALKNQSTENSTDISTFMDITQISPYALPALRWANGAGLISGTDWGGLAPQATTSRAEAAQIFMNYFQKAMESQLETAENISQMGE